MNKAEALKLFEEVQTKQGEHNGRWEDEYSQEYSSEIYLAEMISYAEFLEIEFDKDPESYREDEDDHDYMVWDQMGFEIKTLIDKKLRDIILD